MNAPTSPREASGIVVLGSGRGGTSAITRAFLASGFFAGHEADLFGPGLGNPLGHFEPRSVLELNEELLEGFGCSWWADSPLPEEQLPHLAETAPRLKAVITTLIASADGAPVAVKEPRINGLLPLWQPVIEGVLHPVFAVRDPLEIAFSHSRRDGTSVPHALCAWEAQTALVLRWLEGQTATIARYNELIAQPELAVELVRDATSYLDPARASHVDATRAGSALRPDLRHEDAMGLDHRDFLTRRQSDLWDHIRSLSSGSAQLGLPDGLPESRATAYATMRKESERVRLLESQAVLTAELSEVNERAAAREQRFAEAILLARQAVSAANERANRAVQAAVQADLRHARELKSIKDSPSWRLTAPMRLLKRILLRTPSNTSPTTADPSSELGSREGAPK